MLVQNMSPLALIIEDVNCVTAILAVKASESTPPSLIDIVRAALPLNVVPELSCKVASSTVRLFKLPPSVTPLIESSANFATGISSLSISATIAAAKVSETAAASKVAAVIVPLALISPEAVIWLLISKSPTISIPLVSTVNSVEPPSAWREILLSAGW